MASTAWRSVKIEHIVKDIMHLITKFTLMGFLWTNRGGNAMADLVVKLGLVDSLPRKWVL